MERNQNYDNTDSNDFRNQRNKNNSGESEQKYFGSPKIEGWDSHDTRNDDIYNNATRNQQNRYYNQEKYYPDMYSESQNGGRSNPYSESFIQPNYIKSIQGGNARPPINRSPSVHATSTYASSVQQTVLDRFRNSPSPSNLVQTNSNNSRYSESTWNIQRNASKRTQEPVEKEKPTSEVSSSNQAPAPAEKGSRGHKKDKENKKDSERTEYPKQMARRRGKPAKRSPESKSQKPNEAKDHIPRKTEVDTPTSFTQLANLDDSDDNAPNSRKDYNRQLKYPSLDGIIDDLTESRKQGSSINQYKIDEFQTMLLTGLDSNYRVSNPLPPNDIEESQKELYSALGLEECAVPPPYWQNEDPLISEMCVISSKRLGHTLFISNHN